MAAMANAATALMARAKLKAFAAVRQMYDDEVDPPGQHAMPAPIIPAGGGMAVALTPRLGPAQPGMIQPSMQQLVAAAALQAYTSDTHAGSAFNEGLAPAARAAAARLRRGSVDSSGRAPGSATTKGKDGEHVHTHRDRGTSGGGGGGRGSIDEIILFQKPTVASKNLDPDICTYCTKRVLDVNYGGEIQCESCDRWYHLVCLNKTPEYADSPHKYRCNSCRSKRSIH